jgi:aminoglycoside 3-N-acetyltransferase
MPDVQTNDIEAAARQLGLADRPVCVHSSLRSFGHVEGGAQSVVDGLLSAGCTVLVPTFSWEAFALPPPVDLRPARNGTADATSFGSAHSRRFTPESNELDDDMGAIPRNVLERRGRARGNHPIASFSAVGPLATMLVATQRPTDVFAPLRELVSAEGFVLLAGVGLTSMTLLHLAEQEAGRAPFLRWAADEEGEVAYAAVGGCSAGFASFEGLLDDRELHVGSSRWRVFHARRALEAAARAIGENPSITACADGDCLRCLDAVAGGPIL